MTVWWLAVMAMVEGSAGTTRSAVIIPFQSPVAHEETARRAEGLLRDAAEKLPQLKVLRRAETETLLEQAADGGWKCRGSTACYTELGPLLGAETLLVGEVAAGAEITVSITKYNMATKQVENRITEVISGDSITVSETMRKAAVQLLAPSSFVGALDLDCRVKGATVWVGTTRIMNCPRRYMVTELLAGAYAVTVKKPGMEDVLRRVDVRYERVTLLRVEKEKKGATITVDPQTQPMPAKPLEEPQPSPAAGSKASKSIPPVEEGRSLPVLAVSGGVVSAAGAVVALVGAGLGAVAGILTLLWPRTTPVVGDVVRLPGESVSMAAVRIYGVAAMVPMGLGVAVWGLVVGTIGLALVVVDVLK